MNARLFRSAIVLGLLAAGTEAQQAHPFPMQVLADRGADGLELVLLVAEAEALQGLPEVVLTGVPLSAGSSVSLVLHRVRVATPDSVLAVNGVERPGARLEQDLSMWSGRVAGEPGSGAYLAFSPLGSRGWIRTSEGLHHLLAQPGAADGSSSTSRLVTEERLRELGMEPDLACAVDRIAQPFAPDRPVPVDASATQDAASPLPLFECAIAVETDTQLAYALGSIDATRTYVLALFGAVADRYREQIGAILTLPYLGLHDPYLGTDPWTTQETGGGCGDLLDEFRAAWSCGTAPVDADLYHFLSGANLGCGVAWVGTICDPSYGFSVSGNVNGSTPFPIAIGPLNWDFFVMAHELGHNFGTWHTHDYCPPLDECSGGFGQCQTQQQCIWYGTIMSYCHGCPGGMWNITTYFHPVVAGVMRDFVVQNSCLQPFDGLFETDLGQALAGSGGTPSLAASFQAGPNTVVLDITQAPASTGGTLVISHALLMKPFHGGVFVPALTLLVPIVSPPSGAFTLPLAVPSDITFPDGALLYMQAWFPDTGGAFGYSATNGIETEIILSDPLPDPVWIPHPGNGKEYALSQRGSFGHNQSEAESHGGNLVTIDSQALNDWLVATFEPLTSKGSAFIGFTDAASEGTFAWTSGAPTGFTHWAAGEPNDAGPCGEDHAEMYFSTGLWNDNKGTGPYLVHGLMERPVSP